MARSWSDLREHLHRLQYDAATVEPDNAEGTLVLACGLVEEALRLTFQTDVGAKPNLADLLTAARDRARVERYRHAFDAALDCVDLRNDVAHGHVRYAGNTFRAEIRALLRVVRIACKNRQVKPAWLLAPTRELDRLLAEHLPSVRGVTTIEAAVNRINAESLLAIWLAFDTARELEKGAGVSLDTSDLGKSSASFLESEVALFRVYFLLPRLLDHKNLGEIAELHDLDEPKPSYDEIVRTASQYAKLTPGAGLASIQFVRSKIISGISRREGLVFDSLVSAVGPNSRAADDAKFLDSLASIDGMAIRKQHLMRAIDHREMLERFWGS
jgi:hypothetical protein